MIYDFQIHKIENNIATGFLIVGNEPQKDNFWCQTGEVKFGGGYQETGSWDLVGFENAKDLYRVRNIVRTVKLPEDKTFLVGHCLRVNFESYLHNIGTFKRYSTLRPNYIPEPRELYNKTKI